mgnify:CR=1 FL=1
MISLFSHKKAKLHSGFTLIEMLVVIALFSILSGIVLLNYRGFGSDLLLTNLSYDIALSLRKAQSYGVSVKSLSSGTSNFTYSYGVHFNVGSFGGTQTSYSLFIDNSTTGSNANVYDGGDTILETYTITNQNKILELCYRLNSNDPSDTCTNQGSNNPAVIDILFKRPNPDAVITRCPNDNNLSNCIPDNATAKIRLQSVRGIIRDVTVRDTGEISVK